METAMSLLWTKLNHSQKGEVKYIFILDWNLYHDSWNGREKVEEEKQEDKNDGGGGRKGGERKEGRWGLKIIPCVSAWRRLGAEAASWKVLHPLLLTRLVLFQVSQRLCQTRALAGPTVCWLMWLESPLPQGLSPAPVTEKKPEILPLEANSLRNSF